MDLIVVGPGRAGGSICLASAGSGHRIVGVLSRSGTDRYGPALSWDRPLPAADVALIAVTDGAIAEVARRLAGIARGVEVAAHLSGFAPVSILEPLREDGVAIGGFHPLQTLPDPERGAAALAGSHAGVGGDAMAVAVLERLASSLAMHHFPLRDEARPAYHAAAAAASNFVVTALATAGDLFSVAGVDPGVARPLVQRAVENVYTSDPLTALTGPVARGDHDTVAGHLGAARSVSEGLGRRYRLLAEATAILAGRGQDARRWK